jgi:ferric-chelate reductase
MSAYFRKPRPTSLGKTLTRQFSRRYIPYFYVTFAIWGLDRLLRFLRLVLCNISYTASTRGSTLDARIELVSENSARLTLCRPLHAHWSAGKTAYIILPGVSTLPFEAHPFTIASIKPISDHKDSVERSNPGGSEEGSPDADKSRLKQLVFLVDIRGGFTKRLATIAATKGAVVKCLLDGPYGSTPDLSGSDSCVLICGEVFSKRCETTRPHTSLRGGSGVAHSLPLFLDTIE